MWSIRGNRGVPSPSIRRGGIGELTDAVEIEFHFRRAAHAGANGDAARNVRTCSRCCDGDRFAGVDGERRDAARRRASGVADLNLILAGSVRGVAGGRGQRNHRTIEAPDVSERPARRDNSEGGILPGCNYGVLRRLCDDRLLRRSSGAKGVFDNRLVGGVILCRHKRLPLLLGVIVELSRRVTGD